MTQQTHVAIWLLLSSLLSVCLSSVPPLATIHNINSVGRQREQTVNEGENVGKRARLLDQDKGREVDVVPLLRLNNVMWRDIDRGDGSDLLKRDHSLPRPLLQQPTMPVRGEKVDIKESTDSQVTPAFTTTVAATKNMNTATTTTTTTPHPVVPTPPPLSSSSSCSSPACKWLSSPHFIAVVSMTVAWLVAVTVLYWMTRTVRGKQLLEAWSSLFACDKKDQEENQVLAKGIGYFDGSPGLRRFVLIEDDDGEEEEEDNEDDLFASEFKDARKKEDKETEGEGTGENRMPAKWKPPRKGTYILQEASKKDVLEVGTYRLQEEEEEDEEEEVDGKRKRREGKKEEEVEYILEGPTYILQSERVGRRGMEEAYGQIGGIEGLYGVVGRGLEGYGRIEGLEKVYRMMGRGDEQGRYGRTGGIEGLYGLLREGETGRREEGYKEPVGVGRRRKGEEDGVILSVSELEGAVGGIEHVREESTGGGGRGEESEGRRGGYGGKQREDGVKEVKRRSLEERRERGGRRTDEREREKREVGYALGWRRGAARANLGRGWSEGTEGYTLHSPPPQKRAASFPMDHFLSHLMPRKLSLIVEEENH